MNRTCLPVSALVTLLAVYCVLPASAAENAARKPDADAPARTLIPRGDRTLYRLGPGDEVKVFQENAPELDGKTARIDDLGFINLPLTGRVKLSGLTLEESEKALATPLSKYLISPNPVVSITEYRSQPVSVLGAVNTPGVLQLQGRKTLVEMLSMAGGVRADAGTEVEITRRLSFGPLPLPNAAPDASGDFSTAKIDLVTLLKGTAPGSNITIVPQDVISVPRAELIYVTGTVKKPGGFPLSTNGTISVLQALSLAEGIGPDAAAHNARIIRSPNGDGDRQEIPVDVANILRGKTPDFDLKPRDILFIPDSTSRKAGTRFAEAALQAVTGIAIWRVW
ncbi:MAG TPA: polysaccharide biosynthesis/export family protein [Bryobacteraceae bacterium]|jgi:polysaccharide export outer membrane protein|nr:polysaccharide biosynthesis/export family protein [Bryobacteraceae bacterium]